MRQYLLLPLFAAGCTAQGVVPCVPECAPGWSCIDATCVPGASVDMAAGGDGAAGACQPACGGLTPYCNGAGHCVGCTMDAQCPAGKFCKVTDDAHATCAIGCASDDRCGAGRCCNMQCADVANDVRNCGACGKACDVPNADAACASGQCQAGACHPGWGDCNNDAKDGCETNLHVDAANCTACGTACDLPHALGGGACADGCYIGACDFGYDDCNQDPKDGCETPVLTDADNCGGCGVPCTGLPNAQANCTNGNCVLGACNAGFANCDGNPQNGCEANLSRDPMNCGGCGKVCPMNLPFCNNGACANGCLAKGAIPPQACDTGKDPQTGKAWVICEADCQHAWISQADMAGGSFHPLEICQSLGYTVFGMWDGDCGNVCGYCQGATSCKMPGMKMFGRSPNAPNCGSDQFGPVICNTVQWLCMP